MQLSTTILEVPLWQMALSLSIMLLCLACRRHVLGLLVATLFNMYWGYVKNIDKFIADPHRFGGITLGFIFTGAVNTLVVIALALYSFSLKE